MGLACWSYSWIASEYVSQRAVRSRFAEAEETNSARRGIKVTFCIILAGWTVLSLVTKIGTSSKTRVSVHNSHWTLFL